jgi:hypothetical protein
MVSFVRSLVVFQVGNGVRDWGGRREVLYSAHVEDGKAPGTSRIGVVRSGSVRFDTWCVTCVRVRRRLTDG